MEKKKIHFVGIGGVGMGSLASSLASAGHEVTGSDGAIYEPMKSVLLGSKIALIEGYQAQTCEKLHPDVVIIGNVVRKDNPEAATWIRKGTPFLSFPEAVRRLIIEDRKSIVCSGTHGKTTTTSWLSFLLRELGLKPSYLVGGVPRDLPAGCLIDEGEWFVGEGDEYDSAFFDKGPKFLHYNPHFLIVSSIEFDHADIYRDLAHVQASFEKLVALVPGDGLCIGRYDDKVVMDVLGQALSPVQTFGVGSGAMWRLGDVKETEAGFDFEVLYKGRSAGRFQSPLFGEYNLMNLISGMVATVNMGIPLEKVRPIVTRFQGAKRRQEILMREPNLVIDDFAHHPTEVKATLNGVKRRFPARKLWALFEPRSATARRNVHQGEYKTAFEAADHVLLAEPFKATELAEDVRLSSEKLAEEIRASGKQAQVFPDTKALLENLLNGVQKGDAIVIMSNGEFQKIQAQIVQALQ